MNPPKRTPQSRPAPAPKEEGGLVLDYAHLARLCLKHWKWLAGSVILGAIAGMLYGMSQMTIYSATSTILVEGQNMAPGFETVKTGKALGVDLIPTYVELLQNRELADRVVRKNKLNENPDFFGPDTAVPASEDYAGALLSNLTDVRRRPLTTLIDITVEHHDPKMAKLLADEMAQAAIEQARDETGTGVNALADSFQNEIVQMQKQLAEAENKVLDYQKTHPGGLGLEDNYNQSGKQVEELESQYNQKQTEVSLLRERYGENHPRLVEAEHEADQLREQLNRASDTTLSQGGTAVEYRQLSAQASSIREQLAQLQKAYQEANVTAHVSTPGISIAAPAQMPWGPIRPDKTKDVALGAFAGLLGGVAFILGLYFIDRSVRTVSQAESVLNTPVIAAVPILPETERKDGLPTYADPQSFVAESFRGLRASLLLHDRQNPLKTILVGSAIPGEGKSFCAANLAATFAQAGLKTLLIDGDLRLPTAHTYFSVEEKGVAGGFPAVLSGRLPLAKGVQPSLITNLDLLLTHQPAESPAELLSSPSLARMMQEAAAAYDRVVLDSAPLNAVSDTMLLLPHTDAILLVVRAGSTPASESKAALGRIHSSRQRALGLILNYLAPHTLKAYAYGYSYGQKPPTKNAK